MKPLKSKSIDPHYSDKYIESSTERTRFFSYESILECIDQVYPINGGIRVVGYRVTDDGIELLLK
jgi:hypothetical protein